MRKNVLMVIDSLRMGGAERVTLTLAELFVKAGISVDIITVYDAVQYEVPAEVTVHTIGFEKKLFQNIRYTKRLENKIKALELQQGKAFDLVLVHLLKAARLMQFFKHSHLYFVLHSTMSQESLSGLNSVKQKRKVKRLQRKFDHKNIITISKGMAEDLTNVMKIRPRSLHVIYNPVDVAKIKSLAEEENPFAEEQPYIVHLGRLVRIKRHDRLLDAFKQSGIDAKLIFIGEGDYRKAIEEKIAELGLQSRVILAGMRTNPYPILHDAKLLVLSSDYEGLPTVILEALALDVPVVSTNCSSGPKEILEGYLDNALVDPDDTKALAMMMRKQFDQPALIAPNILDRFEGRHIIEQYIELMK